MQSKKTFACFAKIKSDTKNKTVPDISREELVYYQHDFKTNFFTKEVFNIDLKSAYATILRNDGFIGDDTYRYICKANKKERLASVGMLAARKRVFTFRGGSPINECEIVSARTGIFYHAVKRTFEIMSDLKKISGSSYLYSWVDGIYYSPNAAAKKEMIDYLKDINFDFTFDLLKNFRVRIGGSFTTVDFFKDGKLKIFNLPSQSTEFKRAALEAIVRMSRSENDTIQSNYKTRFPKKDKRKVA